MWQFGSYRRDWAGLFGSTAAHSEWRDPLKRWEQTSVTTTPPDWQAAASGDLRMRSIHEKKTETETETYGGSMDRADPHIPWWRRKTAPTHCSCELGAWQLQLQPSPKQYLLEKESWSQVHFLLERARCWGAADPTPLVFAIKTSLMNQYHLALTAINSRPYRTSSHP